MMIKGKGIDDLLLFHKGEACAINQAEILVMVFIQNLPRPLEILSAHGLRRNEVASHRIPEFSSSNFAQPVVNQRPSLHEDILRSYKKSGFEM